MSRLLRGCWALALAGTASLAVSCKVDDARYRSAFYPCDSTSTNAGQCGSGYLCFPARQVGASTDFCVPQCTVGPSGPIQESTWCVNGQYQLATCDSGRPCASGFSCVRNALEGTGGVCLPIVSCQTNDDCTDPARGTCLSFLTAGTYPLEYTQDPSAHDAAAPMSCTGPGCPGTASWPDRMFCVTYGCSLGVTSCEPGDICLVNALKQGLAGLVGAGATGSGRAPDICVPRCSGPSHACPPTTACGDEMGLDLLTSGQDFCIPGFLGDPCKDDTECLAQGSQSCQPIAPGKSVCSVECSTDADCAPWDHQAILGGWSHFVCLQGHCLSPASLRNQFCFKDADCNRGGGSANACLGVAGAFGVCVPHCTTPNVACATSYPSTCAPLLNVCVPAEPGAYCVAPTGGAKDVCPSPLSCQPVPGKLTDECMKGCTQDSDCSGGWFRALGSTNQPVTGACNTSIHFCGYGKGAACTSNDQCASASCSGGYCQ